MNKISDHKFFIILLLFTALILSPGVTPSFSSDDYVHLLNNSDFTSAHDLLKIFTEPYGREYRPMVRLSLWVNTLMSDNAIAFKITNLVLHLVTATLVYILLLKLNFNIKAAFIGAALFALHPIHITNVHFILGRTDLVLAIFYFSTLVIVSQWQDKISRKQILLTFLFFSLSMLSKEMWISLPISMFAVLLVKQEQLNWRTISKSALRILPFFIISLMYLVIRVSLWSQQPDHIAVYTDYSLANFIKNYAYWIFGLLYPFDLYYAQDLMLANPVIFILWISLALFFILVAIAYLLYPNITSFLKSKWILFSLCWFVITLVPISGGYAHRWYLYIPSFSLSILIAAIFTQIAEKRTKKLFTIAFMVAVVIIYTIESFRLSLIWNKQSDYCEDFLNKIKELNIDREKEIYFANVPFGYKSAYLFTHNSLQEAIQYHYGKSPVIHVISYLNLDDRNQISVSVTDDQMSFHLNPNRYQFMLVTASERRFEEKKIFDKEAIEIRILETTNNGKAVQYSISKTSKNTSPLYYFDGSSNSLIKKF